jgi:ATP-dependent helicase/DNAse subunit B
LFYQVDERASAFLSSKYDMSFERSLAICQSIRYLLRDSYSDDALNEYVSYKRELARNRLLHLDDVFLTLLKKKHLFIYEDQLDSTVTNRLQELGIVFETIKLASDSSPRTAFKFDTIYEEVQHVSNQIATLIKNGVDVNRIFICGADDSYRFIMQKYCPMFGFSVLFPEERKLSSHRLGKEFLKSVVTSSLNDVYSSLKDRCRDEIDLKNLKLIISSLLPYESMNLPSRLRSEVFRSILSTKPCISQKFKNVVRVIDDFTSDPDDHIFVVNFSNGVFPRVYSDDSFLSDRQKRMLGLAASDELNSISKDNTIRAISQMNIKSISFKEKSLGNQCYISFLIKELNIAIISPDFQNEQYGKVFLELLLASLYDLKRKYLFIDERYATLDSRIYIPYFKYDHSYKMVNAVSSNGIMKYSFSQFASFYECGFKYYVDRILGIGEFERSFSADCGSLIHSVLQRISNPDLDYEKAFELEMAKYPFSSREKMFLEKVKYNTENVIRFISEHEINNPYIEKILRETPVSYKLSDNSSISGFIDKIILTSIKNKRGYAIIDYKSTVHEFNEQEVKYGYSLQLPLYSLISKSLSDIESRTLFGVYFEQITSKINAPADMYQPTTDYYKQFMLRGVTLDDRDFIESISNNYAMQSDYIKGMKVLKDGSFDRRFKMRNSDEMYDLQRSALDTALKADSDIRNNRFYINPKQINKKNTPCKYCEFRDICYRRDADIVQIDLNSEEEEKDER